MSVKNSTLTRRFAPPSPSGRGDAARAIFLPLGVVGVQRWVRVEFSQPLSPAPSFVADVRPGEAPPPLLPTANVFAVLASYYVLKTVREALTLSEAGAEVKSYSAAAQALLLLAVIPAYSFVT